MPNRLNNRGPQYGRQTPIFNITAVIIAILLAATISEFVLRKGGRTPGYIQKYGLIPVDQLKVFEPPQFITDQEGVFRANLNYKWPEEFKINSAGFRSIEFHPDKTSQKKILFLGDSFTWGSGADPITESFADIISRHDYITFNMGIPGTGPIQYAFLAEKYVPVLKPDIIIIVFCMRNDFDFPHPMLTGKNLWHVTNAGWLYARDNNGNYISAEDAYVRYYAKIYGEKNIIQNVFYRSVIGTYIYVMFSKIKYKLMGNTNRENMKYNRNIVRSILQRIKKVAEENGSEVMLYVIPVRYKSVMNDFYNIEKNSHVFKGFNLFYPDFLNKNDYVPDGHFNNSGNRKYAEFILKGILEQGNN